jgi:hypothetical protein
MRTTRIGAAALLLGLGMFGCGETRVPPIDESFGTPISIEGALLYPPNNDDTAAALLLDVAKGEVSRRSLPAGKARAYAYADHPGQALLLTEGRPASLIDGKGEDAVASHVMVWDRSGETKRYALSARYSALAISDDGRYAIAYGASGSWATADNVGIVDLELPPSDKPIESTTVRALDGQGPSAVAFSPRGSRRRLAVLVMTDAVNVIDLEHPERRDKVLPLKLPNGSPALRAKQVLFAGERCFVQPDRGSDVLVLDFTDDGSAGGFQAALSTRGTEGTLQDIALLEGGDSPRLLALGQSSLRLIDTVSGAGESSNTQGNFSVIHTFEGRSPFDAEPRQRAILYSQAGSKLGFVDLQTELRGSERGVEQLSLSGAIDDIVFPSQQSIAIIAQSDNKVSLVDLEERTISSFGVEGKVSHLVLDERAGVQQVWISTETGSLGSIDLARRAPRQLLLDQAATFVLPVAGATPLLAVGQAGDSGAVLLLDAKEPSRASARKIAGFLYNDYLD